MEFAKGITVKEHSFADGGSVINLSFDIAEFMENPINNDKYINITLRRGKESNKLYAVNNDYYQKDK